MSSDEKLGLSDAPPVIDASPLIHLARAGKLPLLRELFGVVIVPDAVALEVLRDQRDAAATQLQTSDWLRRSAVHVPSDVLVWDLGPGESETIAHAFTTQALAIVDDRAARRCCSALGVRPKGTLSLILMAARAGLVADPVRALHEVRATGMWLTDDPFCEGARAGARDSVTSAPSSRPAPRAATC